MIYYFFFFHCFSYSVCTKITILKTKSRSKSPYQKEILVQSGEIFLYISYLKLWLTLQCALHWSLILSLQIQSLTCCFHLFWFLYTYNHSARQGRLKGDIQQLINFNHKGKHKIGCLPKSLMIFTAYQVQEWCTMILILVKYQP